MSVPDRTFSSFPVKTLQIILSPRCVVLCERVELRKPRVGEHGLSGADPGYSSLWRLACPFSSARSSRPSSAGNYGIRERLFGNDSGAQRPDEPAAAIRAHDRQQINVFKKKRENPSRQRMVFCDGWGLLQHEFAHPGVSRRELTERLVQFFSPTVALQDAFAVGNWKADF